MTTDKKQIRLIVIGLMMGLLLSALDQTIVSTAMPTVIRDLGGISLYSWVFSIYMLASTTGVPIFGKLADLYGRRKIYLTGMTLFIVGSALCGLAGNMTELIIFRGIQGLGAGALMPVAMTIIGDLFPPERRGKMQGLFGAVFGLSSVIGPAVGGFIVDNLDWHWVFYVNLPFGVAAAIILSTALQETKGTEKRAIDWFGALFLSGSIVSFLLALVFGGKSSGPGTRYAWDSLQIIGLLSAGTLLLGLFIFVESRVKEPIIPLYLFKYRAISVSSIAGFFMGAGMFGAITYIPLFVQGVIGSSPTRAGYILTPLMLSLITASIIGGRIITKVSYRSIIMVSMSIMTISFYLMAHMDIHTSNTTVIWYMILTGLGMGALMPTFTIAVQSAVGREVRGVATSSSQFFRQIGGTVGVSIMGALMANRMASGLTDLAQQFKAIPAKQLALFANPQALLDPAVKQKMPHELLVGLQKVLAHSIDWVFTTGMILVFVGLIAGFFMGNESLKKSKQNSPDNAELEAQLQTANIEA